MKNKKIKRRQRKIKASEFGRLFEKGSVLNYLEVDKLAKKRDKGASDKDFTDIKNW